MPLYIADPKTAELAEELSKILGTTKTEAVRRALSAEVKRLKNEATGEERIKRILETSRQMAEQLLSPRMTQDEIDDWLYDENGLPH